MGRQDSGPVIGRVLKEQSQAYETREHIFASLERELRKPVVSFFTSFRHPVMIDDSDSDMLEGVLQKMDL